MIALLNKTEGGEISRLMKMEEEQLLSGRHTRYTRLYVKKTVVKYFWKLYAIFYTIDKV